MPDGLLQLSKGEAVKIFLASVSSGTYDRTGRNAVLGLQPKGVVARLTTWYELSELLQWPSHDDVNVLNIVICGLWC